MLKDVNPKWCRSPKDVPDHDHYAILVFGSIYIPGDERSRTNPGHGYGERSESTVEYIVYKNREEWEADIQHRMTSPYGSKNDFVPIVVKRASVTTSVHVNTGDTK
jgi:hypothetical protein